MDQYAADILGSSVQFEMRFEVDMRLSSILRAFAAAAVLLIFNATAFGQSAPATPADLVVLHGKVSGLNIA